MCTVLCGVGGTQQRYREVVRFPSGGGNQCRHLAEERFGCNEHIPCKDQIGKCAELFKFEYSKDSIGIY